MPRRWRRKRLGGDRINQNVSGQRPRPCGNTRVHSRARLYPVFGIRRRRVLGRNGCPTPPGADDAPPLSSPRRPRARARHRWNGRRRRATTNAARHSNGHNDDDDNDDGNRRQPTTADAGDRKRVGGRACVRPARSGDGRVRPVRSDDGLAEKRTFGGDGDGDGGRRGRGRARW